MPTALPEIPALLTVERRVAELSHEIAEELGMILCSGPCDRYYAKEQLDTTNWRRPICACCKEEAYGHDDGRSDWFLERDQPRRI